MRTATRQGAGKVLEPVATILYRIKVKEGVPGVELQGHRLQPMLNADGTHVDYRYDLTQAPTTCACKPDAVQLPVQCQPVQSNTFGQHLCHNELSDFKFPERVSVLWECQFDYTPPPSINVEQAQGAVAWQSQVGAWPFLLVRLKED